MNKELSLQEKKLIEKGILDYVVSVCNKNKIKYILAFGTMLGAIRHKGFIPWDDDIDVALLRADYEKLVDILRCDNNPRYKLIDYKVEGYYYPFAKVVDSYTRVEEKNVDANEDMGLWVDLFPLDGVKGPNSKYVAFIRFLDKCRAASVNLTFPNEKYSSWFYIPWKICRIIGYKFFIKKIIKLSQKYSVDECDFVDCISESDSKCVPSRLFKSLITTPFEGDEYLVPLDYDTYLKMVYGDYMKLPPESARVTHNMKAFFIDE